MKEMTENNRTIQIIGNNTLKVTGVKNVLNISENDAVIVFDGELLHIKGENIQAEKLSVETGELSLIGKFMCLKFENEKTKQSLFKRIFK